MPYNYGTSLIDMTILTTDGANILAQYSEYSYEQFTQVLRCATNAYTVDSPGLVSEFINGTNTVFCFFGYIWVILFVGLYVAYQVKLDLPRVLLDRKEKKEEKQLYHFLTFMAVLPGVMFCFFYTFAIEYLMQVYPCFGIENLAYP